MPGDAAFERKFATGRGRVAWYHPAGWCIYPDGSKGSTPADVYLGADGSTLICDRLQVHYRAFQPSRAGGKLYYVPEFDDLMNSVTGGGSPHVPSNFGYSIVWVRVRVQTASVQGRWRCDCVPNGGLSLPRTMDYKCGRVYPEWPPRQRGRPPGS